MPPSSRATPTIEVHADADASADAAIERTIVLVAARNEAERLGATIAAARRALPRAELWVADDGSRDATAAIGSAMGARVVSLRRSQGKGAAVEAALRASLDAAGTTMRPIAAREESTLVLLCDGDLAESAHALGALVEVAGQEAGRLVVARFRHARGGGLGVLRRLAARAILRAGAAARPQAPLSGQRALRASELRPLLPLADGYGLEVGMTIDALRAGMTLVEVPLSLSHRAVGRTPAGFAHRGRQLLHVARACRVRSRTTAAWRNERVAGT
jgi:hypothetical protein